MFLDRLHMGNFALENTMFWKDLENIKDACDISEKLIKPNIRRKYDKSRGNGHASHCSRF